MSSFHTPNKTLDSTKILSSNCETAIKQDWKPLKKDILDEEIDLIEDNDEFDKIDEKENKNIFLKLPQSKTKKELLKPKNSSRNKKNTSEKEMNAIQIEKFFNEIEKRKKEEGNLSKRENNEKKLDYSKIQKKKFLSPSKLNKNRNKILK